MRDDLRYRDGLHLPGVDAATKAATAKLFAATDRLTARGILLRAGRRVVPVLPRAPLVAFVAALLLAHPAPGEAQSAVRATATASARILPSSLRLSGGVVMVAHAATPAAATVLTLMPPPVERGCDARSAAGPCRMLVVDLP